MNIEDFREYCLSLGNVTEKMPFGRFSKQYDSTLVFYVCGHMFCIVDIGNFTSVNVKSDATDIALLNEDYQAVEHPINPTLKDWIKIELGKDMSDSEILLLVKKSHNIIYTHYNNKK